MENKEKTPIDTINALAFYKASEAGAFEEPIEPTEAGIKGAFVTDTINTLNQVATGQITTQEGIQNIETTVKTAITATVIMAMNRLVDVTASFIKMRVPTIAPIVEVGKTIVKTIIQSKVAQKVAEKVSAGVNWVKDKLRSLFG